jgi:hypothetical protein
LVWLMLSQYLGVTSCFEGITSSAAAACACNWKYGLRKSRAGRRTAPAAPRRAGYGPHLGANRAEAPAGAGWGRPDATLHCSGANRGRHGS